MPQPFETRFSARKLPWLFGKCAAVLVALHIVVLAVYFGHDTLGDFELRWWHVKFFDLDTEESFGTWFSAVLLLVTGRFLWLQARAVKAAGGGGSAWWAVLAVGFHFLSLDEVVGLHEYLNEMLADYGPADTKWTHVLGPVALLIGLAYVPWLLKLPRKTAAIFVVGGVLYLGGAVLVEGYTDPYVDWGKLNTLEYHLWIALEEGLEMLGVIVFLRGLLGHMAGAEGSAVVATRVEDGGRLPTGARS